MLINRFIKRVNLILNYIITAICLIVTTATIVQTKVIKKITITIYVKVDGEELGRSRNYSIAFGSIKNTLVL